MSDLGNTSVVPRSTPPFLAPDRVVVNDFHRESHDTVTLTISRPRAYPSWCPGQFNMLYLFGLGEAPLSISGSLLDTENLTHTIKAVGPVTNALAKLAEGDELWLRGPYGSAWPEVDDNEDLLLVAGGIGLAPLRPILLQRVQVGAKGKTILLYGTRSPEDVLFSDELSKWEQLGNLSVHVTVDRVSEGSRHQWLGSVGVVTHLLHHLHLNPKNTIVMTCGPEVMMRHVAADLNLMGIKDDQIFVSLERNMKCAIGLCGRCQWGAQFICRDGPVFRLSEVKRFWSVREF